jgi:uncharacterized protein (TIGR03437 family)
VAGGALLPPTPVPAANASFPAPVAVAVDASGNFYFTAENCVFKVDSSRTLTRIAGVAVAGYSGDGGPATSASLNEPLGLAVDSVGNLYIADNGNDVVRKVTANGIITTFAGNGTKGYSGDGGLATNAQLWLEVPEGYPPMQGEFLVVYPAPLGLATDASGNLYIADIVNGRVRKVAANGVIATVAQIANPVGLAVDAGGNIYVADSNVVHKVTANGVITTVAAQLSYPEGVAVDATGNLYVSTYPGLVQKVATSGVITTLINPGCGVASCDFVMGSSGIAVDAGGNVYFADWLNNVIMEVSSSGAITTAAGNGAVGDSGDGGAATRAQLVVPRELALDKGGDIYIADTQNNEIRKVDANGIITKVAGTGYAGYFGDGGLATSAGLGIPQGVGVDSAGNLYIADFQNNVVRKVSANGVITTFAGNGVSGYSGDGGPAASAELANPDRVAVDASGTVYIADYWDCVVRAVSANGTITTVAGTGSAGYSGDGGPATRAQLNIPVGVALDGAGNIYIADAGNNVVRRIAKNGVITTVAGNGTAGYSGDGGSATGAELNDPTDVAVDAFGNIYIADSKNHSIRRAWANGTITTVAGNGTSGYSGDGGPASGALLNTPKDLVLDSAGNIYVADSGNNVIRLLAAASAPAMVVTKTHQGDFAPGQTGVTYSVVVSNAGTVGPTSGAVSVTDTIPGGLTLVSMSGTGWSCSSNSCTRTDALNPGSSYPPITVTVNVAPSAPLQVTNQVSVSGGGSATASASDPTTILAPLAGPPSLISPANGATGVSPSPTLSWGAPQGALNYDVYFGPLSSPMFVTNTTGTSYSPGTLTAGATYYWQVVAKHGDAALSSPTWSFTTQSSATALSGYVISTVAGNGSQGYSGDGGPAVSAQLNGPSGVAIDGQGNLYIADAKNDVVREVSNGLISTVPGTKTEDSYGYGGTPVVAVDAKGNLYTTAGAAGDAGGNQVLKISNGVASAVAGTGVGGYSGDGGPAISAQINSPYGVTLDAAGNLYIADLGNHRVREVSNGIITTVAGNGTVSASGGDSGDNGPATSAQLGGPMSLASDASGNLYIADSFVRRVSDGEITTVAGGGFSGITNLGDNGPAFNSMLIASGVAAGVNGDLYIADSWNNRIRKVSGGVITTIAGGGVALGDNGPATGAQLSGPQGIAADTAGNVYFSDGNRVRVLVPFGPVCTYSVSPIALTIPASGGNISVGVQTASTCPWAVSWGQPYWSLALPDWVYSSNYGPLAVGTGSDNVAFVVSANSGAPRTFTVSVAGISVVITQQSPGSAPSFTANGVLNAASYAIGSPVAPGSIAAIYGTFLLSAPSQATGAPLPTSLGGLSMQFSNGVEAPLFYASGGQVNLQVPWEVAGQSQVPVTAIVNGQPSAVETVDLSPFAPGIFSMNGQGTGQGAILDPSYRLVDASNPAVPGSTVLLIYCTGLGAVTNQPPTGSPALSDPLSWTTTKPTVTIGGVASTNVSFYGLAPGAAGEYQVNALVPAATPTGTAVPVVISMGGFTSNTVTIAVK